MREVIEGQDVLKLIVPLMKDFKENGIDEARLYGIINERRVNVKKELRAASISRNAEKRELKAISILESLRKELLSGGGFDAMKALFDKKASALKEMAGREAKRLENLFKFTESAFGTAQEMLVLVTDLTVSAVASTFIARFGCDKYFKYNQELQFNEREKQIMFEIEQRDLL